jgi:microcin C transport system substrate-binding protein
MNEPSLRRQEPSETKKQDSRSPPIQSMIRHANRRGINMCSWLLWRSRARIGVFALVLWMGAQAAAAQGGGQPSHGLSAFGELKYRPGYRHFEYVEANAPKGGELILWELETFDNLNPVILKGVPAAGLNLVYETLMARAMDEPDALYGLIAESVELGPKRAFAVFTLNPKARWQDGRPVTADDVVFTFEAIMKEGHPQYRLLYRDVEGVDKLSPLLVRFRFKPGESRRDLPLLVAQMPILARAWFKGRDFAATTLDPPVGSGPYRIAKVDPGRSIHYRRDPAYWGKDLAPNVGRYNFDLIRYDYFRDRDIAFEAFFSGVYDARLEITARNWATGYARRPVLSGFIRREVLADNTPSGVQAFFLNTRRPHLADRRVREALNLAFDYEWLNKTLFYGLYKRTRSMFENSDLAATGLPSEAELRLLEPFRAALPPEVFSKPFDPPEAGDWSKHRANLRQAQHLLAQAGYRLKDGILVDRETGQPFALEFLLFEASFQRVVLPFVRNLERLGITASVRLVDVSTFENRMRAFDYDVIIRRFSQPLTPGVEQRNYWGSAAADVIGGFNFSGIKDKTVDALIERIIGAKDRQALRAACRALDRVLTWGYYTIPQWYSGSYRLAFWDKFSRPKIMPAYDLGLTDTWWIDTEKLERLPARKR